MRSVRIVTSCVFLVLAAGCFPYSGSLQSVSSARFTFIDASSGRSISRVLIFPLYNTRSGYITAAPLDSDGELSDRYLAHPFICRSGESLALVPVRSTGIVVGNYWRIVGTRNTVEGLLLVPPLGYRVRWFNDHLESSQDGDGTTVTISFEPVTPGKERKAHDIMKALLIGELASTEEKPFHEARLTESERQVVLGFFSDSE